MRHVCRALWGHLLPPPPRRVRSSGVPALAGSPRWAGPHAPRSGIRARDPGLGSRGAVLRPGAGSPEEPGARGAAVRPEPAAMGSQPSPHPTPSQGPRVRGSPYVRSSRPPAPRLLLANILVELVLVGEAGAGHRGGHGGGGGRARRALGCARVAATPAPAPARGHGGDTGAGAGDTSARGAGRGPGWAAAPGGERTHARSARSVPARSAPHTYAWGCLGAAVTAAPCTRLARTLRTPCLHSHPQPHPRLYLLSRPRPRAY